MSFKITKFKSSFDNKTNDVTHIESWLLFVDYLKENFKEKGHKPKKGEWITGKCSPLISPAVYKPNATRANVNVDHWAGWVALDIDDYDEDKFNLSSEKSFFDSLINEYKEYKFVIYSTASSTLKKPKFRLVFELDDWIEHNKIADFWFAINSITCPSTTKVSSLIIL